MKTYNHAFTIGFTIASKHPEGDDIRGIVCFADAVRM